MKSLRCLGAVLLVVSLGSCLELDFLTEGDDKDDGKTANAETTTFKGEITNPTALLQRDSERLGAYCCAVPSTLSVVVVCSTGEVAVSAVELDGTFSVTVQSVTCSVLISFVLDSDNDGDFDVFEGTLGFTGSGGGTFQLFAGGGTIDVGIITLVAGLAESSDISATLLATLDADGDGISDFADADANNNGIPDAAEAALIDLDGDGIPNLFDLDFGALVNGTFQFDGTFTFDLP